MIFGIRLAQNNIANRITERIFLLKKVIMPSIKRSHSKNINIF